MPKRLAQSTLTNWVQTKNRRCCRNAKFLLDNDSNCYVLIECGICLETVRGEGLIAQEFAKARSCWKCRHTLCNACYHGLQVNARNENRFAEHLPNCNLTQCPLCRANWIIEYSEVLCCPLTDQEIKEEIDLRRRRLERSEELSELAREQAMHEQVYESEDEISEMGQPEFPNLVVIDDTDHDDDDETYIDE